ncbi:biotin--[acetyl-CoA-carboxylase] ligase [Massilia solisilvae]|uniref:biotin--[biotin carboxyl-carrier protein] ligase n=1 Tax=Massilia solisilvae TaxID=1811225 RepID=A0ABT2BQV0_9BURK|nr:biotin--[acetyl-CoA-carboxylase] ligase [Massilia solisilvae]MCS0610440.1 biotin--[acetyl-CoA-carboxylase] ligase [Massilia solisilvae]
MNAASIAALSTSGVQVEVVPETGSTNVDLLARAGALAQPLLLVAENQTAGRGRAGRSWLSAPGHSLTFSLAWKFESGPQALSGLPLAVGVALAETLGRLGVQVRLKWPNDLLKDGDKLAGILIETAAAPGPGIWAVIGVGLNLVMPDELEREIGRAVSAVPWLARMDRDELIAALLDGLAAMLRQFERTGFSAFAARWNLLHAYQGDTVRILDRGAVLHEGVAAGVDDTGRLLLDTSEGRIAIAAGDVSLRLKE